MAQLPQPIVDYSDKDFDSLRLRLFNLVSAVFPDWTDQNVATFGNILVELMAFVGDVLGFYLDNHALESRIVTATQRRSLIGLSKLIGFTPPGATAAQTEEVFTLAATLPGNLTIPAGSTVRTQAVTDPVVFQLLADLLIPAGSLQGVGTVENSRSHTETFSSTGTAFQTVVLTNTPFLDGSLVLTAANGTYTVVDNFLASEGSDLHAQVTVDQNDRAAIRFGDGVNGQLPTGTITAVYKAGGGADGNVDANTINKLDGNFTDVLGNTAVLSVNNPNQAGGGSPRMSNARIQLEAPASVTTGGDRSVSGPDFEINARRVPQVARAAMITSNERPGVPENTGILYIVPFGGGVASQAIKDAVLTMVTVTFPPTVTFEVTVESAEYLTVDVTARVFLQPNTTASVVDAAIRENLANFFTITLADGTPNTAIDFGSKLVDVNGDPANEIARSDVFNVVRDTVGVRKIGAAASDFLLNAASSDVVIDPQQFPVLGTVALINGDTGAALA